MTENNSNIVESLRTTIKHSDGEDTISMTVNDLTKLLDRVDIAEALTEIQPCKNSHADPYDFDCCETHDKTYEVGGKCPYQGLSVVDYLDETIMKQRMRAMRAEGNFEYAKETIDDIRSVLSSDTTLDSDQIIETVNGYVKRYDNMFQ